MTNLRDRSRESERREGLHVARAQQRLHARQERRRLSICATAPTRLSVATCPPIAHSATRRTARPCATTRIASPCATDRAPSGGVERGGVEGLRQSAVAKGAEADTNPLGEGCQRLGPGRGQRSNPGGAGGCPGGVALGFWERGSTKV